jgi:DNA-binding GntR family transcriptional regulator
MTQDMYGKIQARIMNLEIEPGGRLTVEALAREFDVSPTPIREALSRLESDGLVVKTHLRGFHVAPQQTRKEFESMFEVRGLLEPYAAARAALIATEPQRREIAEAEAAMVAVERDSSGRGYREFALLDARFHSLIAEASGNDIIRDTLDRRHMHLHLFRLRKDQRIADEALKEHHRIVQAIDARDDLLAEAAMRSHINRSLARTLEAFD